MAFLPHGLWSHVLGGLVMRSIAPFLCSLTQPRFLFKNSSLSPLTLAGAGGQAASLLPRGGVGPQESSDPPRPSVCLSACRTAGGSLRGAGSPMSYPCPVLIAPALGCPKEQMWPGQRWEAEGSPQTKQINGAARFSLPKGCDVGPHCCTTAPNPLLRGVSEQLQRLPPVVGSVLCYPGDRARSAPQLSGNGSKRKM